MQIRISEQSETARFRLYLCGKPFQLICVCLLGFVFPYGCRGMWAESQRLPLIMITILSPAETFWGYICFLIENKISLQKQQVSKQFNLVRVCECSCHHKTIRSVGWGLLMQVNIASRAAILIMGNIVQYVVDDYEPLARPTKLPSSFCARCFLSFTRSLQTTLHYWHRWQNIDAYLFFFFCLFHSIQGGMGGTGK